jgi:ribosomal protein S18 acetylase RimI-like enzyme
MGASDTMPTMSESETRLATGERLRLAIVEPPLLGPYRAVEYWWRDVRQAVIDGAWVADSRDRFIFGEIGGEVVGSMLSHAPRVAPEVACLEMVWTREDQRRKGIGAALLTALLADFHAGGGQAMFLCTTNPHAFALYEQCGFQPWIGDGMRYLAPAAEEFDARYFAADGPATIRPITWGDLARASALYNQPRPDWLIKDYPRRVFRGMRYEGHFRQVWLPVQRRAVAPLALETPRGRLVGLASAVSLDSFAEQHVQTAECFAAPAYLDQLPALIEALVAAARSGPAESLQAHVAAPDTDKLRLFIRSGFAIAERRRGYLRRGEQRHDLLVLRRDLGQRRPPARPEASY